MEEGGGREREREREFTVTCHHVNQHTVVTAVELLLGLPSVIQAAIFLLCMCVNS